MTSSKLGRTWQHQNEASLTITQKLLRGAMHPSRSITQHESEQIQVPVGCGPLVLVRWRLACLQLLQFIGVIQYVDVFDECCEVWRDDIP